ncbi:MAG TPA: Uma2 family endonuclease [Thermoanaerobaculia bacterium]|nr:Uma2 family endonuclease [Thermoanaerobaculia bacterium]
MAVAIDDTHRWTREEYERKAEEGFFPPDARVELIEGIVYDMAPQSSFHSAGIGALTQALRTAFPEGHEFRIQMPLALGEYSEPEPDLAVVPGSFIDYIYAHPTTALLVCEVADSSLLHDRRRKVPLYARCGIPEVWLHNLKEKTLEVYRDPVAGQYRSKTVLRKGETVSPLTRPDIQIAIADLFPW